MSYVTRSVFTGAGAAAVALAATGCGTSAVGPKPFAPHKSRAEFFFPLRQLAPEPVYSRVRQVYLPDPLPSPVERGPDDPKIRPVVRLRLVGATMEEAARALGEATRYGSYCSSAIAERPVTYEGVGTPFELAADLSRKFGINVVVDPDLREVRFLGGLGEARPPAGPPVCEPAPGRVSEVPRETPFYRAGPEGTRRRPWRSESPVLTGDGAVGE